MVDLALGHRRRQRQAKGNAVREFLALAGLFATLYGWFVMGAALTA